MVNNNNNPNGIISIKTRTLSIPKKVRTLVREPEVGSEGIQSFTTLHSSITREYIVYFIDWMSNIITTINH